MRHNFDVVFIDHYDSFSFNLIDWLTQYSPSLRIVRVGYDDLIKTGIVPGSDPRPLVVSPGPKSPAAVPQSCEILSSWLGKAPILGVCLGHQVLATVLGGTVVKCRRPFHGSVKVISMSDSSRVYGKSYLKMASYNSLTVNFSESVPAALVTGRSADREIEVIEYLPGSGYPAVGVQFHPESFMSDDSHSLQDFFSSEVLRFYQQKSGSGGPISLIH